MSLVDFLRARAAETLTRSSEVVERHPAPWRRQDDSFRSGVVVDSRGWAVLSGSGMPARHVEDWGPTRAQAVALAVEALLREHRPAGDTGSRYDARACVGCNASFQEEYAVHDVEGCPTLRVAARIWADHADYDPRWGAPESG